MEPDSSKGPSNQVRRGRRRARVATCTGGNRNQAIRALLDRLAREAVIDYVVKHDAAITVNRFVDCRVRAE